MQYKLIICKPCNIIYNSIYTYIIWYVLIVNNDRVSDIDTFGSSYLTEVIVSCVWFR